MGRGGKGRWVGEGRGGERVDLCHHNISSHMRPQHNLRHYTTPHHRTGRTGVYGDFLKGSLAGLMVARTPISGPQVTCLSDCHERLNFQAISEMEPGVVGGGGWWWVVVGGGGWWWVVVGGGGWWWEEV